MATLVGVCREEDYQYKTRQLKLEIDETLTLVVQFPDTYLSFDQNMKNKDYEQFMMKYQVLEDDGLLPAVTVSCIIRMIQPGEWMNILIIGSKELFHALSQTVSCVGCRRSVERLFIQLAESRHPALDPLIVTADCLLTLNEVFVFNPRRLSEFFYIRGNRFNSVIDAIPKNKKNRRCLLHSLESQRSKPVGNWLEVWDLMSKECRDEVVLVEADVLLDTLETYLRKHRFCTECKSKVMRAYNILVGRLDASKEKGYVAHLYKGIRCCPPERHVHVRGDANFISRLITRADPEFRGKSSTRERHAKTVENAQEEVLICLGICLYERFHRIWQRLHEEAQTWQILFYLGVCELRKNFELAVENKQGFSQLERVCEEITREELAKQQRLEHKRQKRKKKKSKHNQIDQASETKENAGDCQCDIDDTGVVVQLFNDCGSDRQSSLCNCDMTREHYTLDRTSTLLVCSCKRCCVQPHKDTWTRGGRYVDSGYSSANSNESPCSSSCENSEIACNEGFCNHESDYHSCQQDSASLGSNEPGSINSLHGEFIGNRRPLFKWPCGGANIRCCMSDSRCGTSLQELLEESGASDEEVDHIPPEEVREFKARLNQLDEQRQELRRVLRQRFAKLKQGVRFRCQPLAPRNNNPA